MPPTIRMNNGVEIPQVGFGVYQIPTSRTTEMVRVALDAGYRHVDTAQVYGNEAEVGTAIVESGLPREDVFITTKLNPQHHGYVSTGRELEESLRKLRTSDGRSVIPKSTKPNRITENIDVFDFDISGDELTATDGLNTDHRGGPEPDAITLEAFGREIPEA
jgi:diketogulonate reductase-like aldo/keto reductase